jgi:hypothetical protein
MHAAAEQMCRMAKRHRSALGLDDLANNVSEFAFAELEDVRRGGRRLDVSHDRRAGASWERLVPMSSPCRCDFWLQGPNRWEADRACIKALSPP